MNLTRLITLVFALAALALPAAATASGDDVIRDCAQDGDLDKEYSDKELREASENMPSDVDAYSNCREVIRRAQAGGRGSADGTGEGGTGGAGGSNGGASGGNFGDGRENSRGGNPTPSDIGEITQRELGARAGVSAATPAELAAGADAGDGSGGLPTAALVAIALLGLAAIAGGVYLLRDHLPPGLTSRLPGTSR